MVACLLFIYFFMHNFLNRCLGCRFFSKDFWVNASDLWASYGWVFCQIWLFSFVHEDLLTVHPCEPSFVFIPNGAWLRSFSIQWNSTRARSLIPSSLFGCLPMKSTTENFISDTLWWSHWLKCHGTSVSPSFFFADLLCSYIRHLRGRSVFPTYCILHVLHSKQ